MYYCCIATETTVETQLSCHMKTYQEHLKSLYKSLELILSLEMLDCFSTQYINLTMCKGEEDDYPNFMFQRNERCDSVTLVEALNVDGQERKVVLILGGPGMGKSTLAINICKQWAEGSLLQDYDAVVLLLLRDQEVQGAKTIKDLLQTLNDDLYKEIVNNNGEKVCFIFEGYDELPYHLQKSSIFTKLIEKLPKCTLVYTSRPEAYYKIPYRGCKIIKINGFNEESVDKYILEAFEKHKNGEEMAQKLKTQVHNNPVVRSILRIPINIAIVCLIFFHYSTLPKTLTELYTKLCLRLILRYIVTRTPNEGQVEKLQSLDNLPTGISEQFLQLCHVAYKGMKNEKIIFSSKDLDVSENKLHGMGLLLIAMTTSVAGREKCYNFLHLTLQEFCAAWYISKLSAEEQVDCMSIFQYQKRFEMVWRFYSGITKLQNKEILEFMLPCEAVKSHFSDQKASVLMNIAYEASSSDVCQIVEDYYKDQSILVIYFEFDELESHAINYVLTQYKGLLRVTTIDFEVLIDWSQQHDVDVNHLLEDMSVKYLNSVYELRVSVSSKELKLISQMLSNSRTLKMLYINGCNKLNKFNRLATLKNILLQDFRVSHCILIPSSLDAIGKMLSNSKFIKHLDLIHNRITDEGIEKLVHHLMDNDTIQQINLSNNKITADGVTHLSKLITKEHSVLTSIELSNNPLTDKGVNLLLQSLPLGIEHIGLCDVQMTPLSCQSLGNALHKVKSISFDKVIDCELDSAVSKGVDVPYEYLEMINNYTKSISTKYWEAITTKLVNTTVLEHLEVRVGGLPTSKLINAIGCNQNIKKLKLLFCQMNCEDPSSAESNWAVELVQCIQHNTSLEQLTISGYTMYALQFFMLLTDSLITNTSIKSVIYKLTILNDDVEGFSVDLYNVYEAIEKVKENNTLEELTFNEVSMDVNMHNNLFLKIENCVQQINRTRNIKGIDKLKVNIAGNDMSYYYYMQDDFNY